MSQSQNHKIMRSLVISYGVGDDEGPLRYARRNGLNDKQARRAVRLACKKYKRGVPSWARIQLGRKGSRGLFHE